MIELALIIIPRILTSLSMSKNRTMQSDEVWLQGSERERKNTSYVVIVVLIAIIKFHYKNVAVFMIMIMIIMIIIITMLLLLSTIVIMNITFWIQIPHWFYMFQLERSHLNACSSRFNVIGKFLQFANVNEEE